MPNCENNDKIHQTFVFLIILGTIVLALMVISSSNLSSNVVFAQHLHRTLHNNTLYEVVKQASGSGEIPHIDVGSSPEGVAVNENTNTVYVANTGSDTISVISGENNTKIGEDIPVGVAPVAIDINEFSDIVYVANVDSDNVSVIDPVTNKVVAGITFHVNPFNSGVILCDDLTTPSPVGQYVYVYAGARCIAEPNTGFEFSSWEENNLKDNSTQPISISRPAPLLDSFFEFFSSKSPNKLEPDTLNVTKFGTFTANFREIPPTIPLGFWFALFTTIAGSITAAFFGALFGQRRKNN